ncbi:MAG: orotate phosphoribosyltransferase [Acidobacteria bacterium]|nr:orotate phosphoribosyltransferase [Acidobacteriota bacterium]
MTTSLTLDELTAAGAHRTGHFRLSSGLHSGDYLQCALYLADPRRAERAGHLIAGGLRGAGIRPELVVSPALGGVIIGHETARALGAPFLFTERVDGRMTLRRGFAIGPGQRIVVVEDVVTTGKSTREVVAVLEQSGGLVIAMASIVNRSGQDNPFAPIPFIPLLSVAFPTWPPEECPLCREGKPIEKPGSRPV